MHNWRRYNRYEMAKKRGSKFGALLWRHLKPQREKPQYRCTTTIHSVYNCSKKVLENLLPVWLLVRTNLFVRSRFFTKFDNCCQRYVATCGKNIFVYVHITVLGPKLLRWNFLQISQLSTRSGAHKRFRRFLDFSQFLTAISRKLAPSSDEDQRGQTSVGFASVLWNESHRFSKVNEKY